MTLVTDNKSIDATKLPKRNSLDHLRLYKKHNPEDFLRLYKRTKTPCSNSCTSMKDFLRLYKRTKNPCSNSCTSKSKHIQIETRGIPSEADIIRLYRKRSLRLYKKDGLRLYWKLRKNLHHRHVQPLKSRIFFTKCHLFKTSM